LGFIAVQTRDDRAWDRLSRYPIPVSFERRETALSVEKLARDPSLLALVVDVADRSGIPTAVAVERVRKAHHGIPILVWCPASDVGTGGLRDLFHSGADGMLLQSPGPFEERTFAQLVPRGELQFHEWVEASIGRISPPDMLPVVSFCLHPVNSEMSVPQVARRFGMARRTLTDHLARARLPSARELLDWRNLLAAAWELEHSDRSVERVALGHGFASASALRAALKRWTNGVPSALRGSGSFGWVLRCFERRVAVLREAAQ
jgi:AraC-like DNA-binding protein